jgi:hypothetical protein
MDSDSIFSASQSGTIDSEELTSSLRSTVHQHCRQRLSDEDQYDAKNRRIYHCKYCDWAKISVLNFRLHLKKKHGVISAADKQDSLDHTPVLAEKLQVLYNELREKN